MTVNVRARETRTRSAVEPTVRSGSSAAHVALPSSFTHDATASAGRAGTGNLVIHGENLGVLEALSPVYEGAVRCIYIDPPYNNQERYRHYDDVGSHDEWLKMIEARLEALKPLMTQDGSIWISIDDRELHYLKVAADRIFGRQNFISTIVWQQRTTRENRKAFSNNHEYVLVYAAKCGAISADPQSRAGYRCGPGPIQEPRRGPSRSVAISLSERTGRSRHSFSALRIGSTQWAPASSARGSVLGLHS